MKSYVIASSHKFKQVNLLAQEAGESKEVQMMLSMSQSNCSNKLIRFDLLVSLFSLISFLLMLAAEMAI